MKEKQKRKSGVARLFEIAGEKKGLLILAGILSAVSALCMLVPYWSVYEVLKELLLHGSKINELDSSVLMHWGWVAFIGLVAGLLLLYGALMASHVAAFRILYGLRIRLSEHIGRLSLGYLNGTSTGAIKKTMEQNIEKIENFVAHTIPDLVNVLATVVLMFIIFFSLNGWMAAICVVCIVCSIGLQFMNFFGKKAKEFMKIYYDTQERMSASAVLRCGGCCDRRTVRNGDPSAYRNGPGQGCAVPAGGQCVCHPADQRHFPAAAVPLWGRKSPHDLRPDLCRTGCPAGRRRCRDG